MRTPASRVVVYAQDAAHTASILQFSGFIRAVARRLEPDDSDVRDDLVQEGMVAVWEMDTTRLLAEDEGYLKRGVAWRMADFMRRERAAPISESSLSKVEIENERIAARR